MLSLGQNKPSIDRTVHFEISENSVHFVAKGGAKTISVTASDPWEIKGDDVSSWCTLLKQEKQLIVTSKENQDFFERSGHVDLSCKSKTIRIVVSQSAAELYLKVSTEDLNFDASGGTKTVTVTTNGNWNLGTNNNSSWIHLTKEENSLTARIDPNPNTSNRNGSFIIKAGNLEKRVNVTQKAAPITLSLSQQELNFDASGGTKTITVTTNGSWSIGTGMKPWGHLTREGNTLNVRVDKNANTSSRTDWFEIKAGSLTKRVDVTQKGDDSFLEVHGYSSNMTTKFDESGGREYYSVRTSATSYETWGIPSWCHIENKTSSGFTLVCDRNPNRSSRNDYMKVKAAGKEIKIEIEQAAATGPSAKINNVWMTFPMGGMTIHVSFDVDGMLNKQGKVKILFYQGNNTTPIYAGWGNQLYSVNSYRPNYDNATYQDYKFFVSNQVFMQYLMPGYWNLSFDVLILDNYGNTLDRKNNMQFTFTRSYY